MSVETFLSFWDHYNTVIIQALIGVVLFITVYVAYRAFFGEEEATASGAGGAAGLDISALEKSLQKLLENQNVKPADGVPAAGGAAPSGASSADLDRLKADIAARDKVIADLQAAAGGGEASSEEKKKLEERLKDLEGRLAEYEIISEDIADLSFYKEENGKLQKEIESLRKGGSASSAEAAAPAAEPAASSVATPEAVAPEPVAAAAAPASPTPPDAAEEALKQMAAAATSTPAAPNPDDSKLMNQFEDFVKKG